MKANSTILKYVKVFKEAQEAEKVAKAKKDAAAAWLLAEGNVIDDWGVDDLELKAIFAEATSLTLVPATTAISFDSSKLKKALPDVYLAFQKVNHRKAYIK